MEFLPSEGVALESDGRVQSETSRSSVPCLLRSLTSGPQLRNGNDVRAAGAFLPSPRLPSPSPGLPKSLPEDVSFTGAQGGEQAEDSGARADGDRRDSGVHPDNSRDGSLMRFKQGDVDTGVSSKAFGHRAGFQIWPYQPPPCSRLFLAPGTCHLVFFKGSLQAGAPT